MIIVGIPTLYALVLRMFFGIKEWSDLFSVMSVSFLFCLPTITGILTVYFSGEDKVRRFRYRFFAPWVPIFSFFLITLLTRLEGWACWLMILPLFLLAASVGGLIGGYFKLKKKANKMYIPALTFFPFLMAPVENMISVTPATYEAITYIDIQAPAEKIWGNVTSVYKIKEEQDKGWLTKLLGLPRPVEAILNYEGVGASREARFTNGLVFHETVSEYTDKKKMVFSIKAYPYEIPSTTMDEHVVIGGKYFDVLNGTYELERLNSTTCRLHLYSRFQLTTNFNFYAGWWAKWIMKDIQNNILQIEKLRSENQ
ncbi:hypothetical protein SAMN04487894_10640 [Niabella drilacis]|uniref:Polyketide cyclase / dehydrase and lipid transport n=1 Tax=Niabella drilacis (strain DSM 25811 / CCM 8410 / CCUG 62505 / LMG 26954 / E90) TaxID=1285928 RepID=A0A1G6S1A6_NIADE|nr:hypothetical protein SAMN04487894_10640 [Niabella drilacis]